MFYAIAKETPYFRGTRGSVLVINTLDFGKASNSDSTSSAEALTSPKETA